MVDYKRKNKKEYKHIPYATNEDSKAIRKRYLVSPQTAYHVQELAFQEQTTEGRIIDKIVRSYLANKAMKYHSTHSEHHYK